MCGSRLRDSVRRGVDADDVETSVGEQADQVSVSAPDVDDSPRVRWDERQHLRCQVCVVVLRARIQPSVELVGRAIARISHMDSVTVLSCQAIVSRSPPRRESARSSHAARLALGIAGVPDSPPRTAYSVAEKESDRKENPATTLLVEGEVAPVWWTPNERQIRCLDLHPELNGI